MNKYQTLAANTILMSVGTFGSKLLVFLMVRFYTGYLTPAEYGTADLITQTANLLIPMVSLDITDAVFRFAAERRGGRTEAFSVGLRVITLGSAGLLLVIALLQGVPAVRAYGFLLASFVIASCCHALCAHFVRARGNTALFAAQGLFNTALFIGLNVLFLAVFHWGIRGYVLSTTVANLITTGLLVFRARLWRYAGLAPRRGLRRQMLRYCIPLIPTAVFWWIMGVSDRYMVKWFLGSDANGIYAVAYKIPTILTILATVFMDAWQLSAIAESDGDRQVHLQFYGRIWDAFASAVFLGAGGIIALSPLLIRLLAEEAYYSAWQYIPVLTLSMAAAAFSNFMGSVYVVTKQSKASFWTFSRGGGEQHCPEPLAHPADRAPGGGGHLPELSCRFPHPPCQRPAAAALLPLRAEAGPGRRHPAAADPLPPFPLAGMAPRADRGAAGPSSAGTSGTLRVVFHRK